MTAFSSPIRRIAFAPVLLAFAAITSPPGQAALIDFENLQDGTVVTTQYSMLGITFSGGGIFRPGSVSTSGVSLNESEFPPYSGSNVLIDMDGPIEGVLTGLVTHVSARITSSVPVTFTIFDLVNGVVGTQTSSLSQNMVSSGNPPNELFSLSHSSGISRFELIGDAGGLSFSLDDLVLSGPATGVPEGATPTFLMLAFTANFCFSRRKIEAA